MEDQHRDDHKIAPRHILMLLSVFMLLVGLIQFYSTPVASEIIIPKNFWIIVLGIFLFAVSLFIRPGNKLRGLSTRLSIPAKAAWIALAFLLSGLAAFTMVAFERGGRVNFIPVLIFWFGAGMIYLSAFNFASTSIAKWREWLIANKSELFWVGLLVMGGAALRFYKLGLAPSVLNGDEGRMGIMAQLTNSGGLANPFSLWENFGALYLQAIDFCFKLFGPTSFALRLLPAIGGVIAIPAVYLLARKIAGRRVAFISAALLAISHTHMHFSRTAAVGYIHATWLVPLELYFLLTGIENRTTWRAALAGILLGIHFSIYLTSQIVVGLVIAFLIIAFLVFRTWLKPALRQVLAFWGGLILMLIPEAIYIAQRPNLFVERLSRDGTFQSGWLELTMVNTGKSAVQLLAERVLHAFLSLIYYPALDFYGSSIPMLSLITAMLFLVGLTVVLLKKQTPKSLLLNGYFWSFTLAVGLFAIPPSADSYRMLIALPAALIMAGIGFDYILDQIGLGWEKARSAYKAVVSITLLSLLVFNMWTYFDDFIGHCLYGDDKPGRFASYLGTYASTLEDRQAPVFLLSDADFFYGSHASAQFLSQNRIITNVPDSINTLSLTTGDIIIATPSRLGELETWARSHPGGMLQEKFDCQVPIMLVYQVP